jgi:hypothetical protein
MVECSWSGLWRLLVKFQRMNARGSDMHALNILPTCFRYRHAGRDELPEKLC